MNKTTLNSQKEKHSMLSLRRATRPGQRLQSVTGFLSTLSLRRATTATLPEVEKTTISIHALLAESDLFNGDQGHIKGDISIHALLAESDSVKSFMRNGFFLISIHALLAESDRGLLWWTTPA